MNEARYQAISSNYKALNYSTMSKLILAAIDEFLAKHLSKEALQEVPKTDEERLAFIVEEMGRLNEENQIKFQAVRKIIPKGTPRPLKESEIEPFMLKIRNAVNKHNGCAKVGRKVVSISREDLERYAKLNRLDIEKNALQASLQACAPISST